MNRLLPLIALVPALLLAGCGRGKSRTIVVEGRGIVRIGNILCQEACEVPASPADAEPIPSEGNQFRGWSGCSLAESCADRTTTALFTSLYRREIQSGVGGVARLNTATQTLVGNALEVWVDTSEKVVIEPIADVGWVFDGWSTPCVGKSACEIFGRADLLVTASFRRLIAFKAEGPGELVLADGSSCRQCLVSSQDLVLARPSPNARFVTFDPPCANPCRPPSSAVEFVARFVDVLRVQRTGDGDAVVVANGVRCDLNVCDFDLVEGRLDLDAVVSEESSFEQWVGCSSSTSTRCVVNSSGIVQLSVRSKLVGWRSVASIESKPRVLECGGRAYAAGLFRDSGISLVDLQSGAVATWAPSIPFVGFDCNASTVLFQFNRASGEPVMGQYPSRLGASDVVLGWVSLDGGEPLRIVPVGSTGDDFAVSSVLGRNDQALVPLKIGAAVASIGDAGVYGVFFARDGGVGTTVSLGPTVARVFAATSETGDFALAGSYLGVAPTNCGVSGFNTDPAPFVSFFDGEGRCTYAVAGNGSRTASVRSLSPRIDLGGVGIVVLSEGSLSFGLTQKPLGGERYHIGTISSSLWSVASVEPVGGCLNSGVEFPDAQRLSVRDGGLVLGGAISCQVRVNGELVGVGGRRGPLLLSLGPSALSSFTPVGEGVFTDTACVQDRVYSVLSSSAGVVFGSKLVDAGFSVVEFRP